MISFFGGVEIIFPIIYFYNSSRSLSSLPPLSLSYLSSRVLSSKINGSKRGGRKLVRESLERESVCICVLHGVMMGHIAKRKKKGRPPKSDLAKCSPKPSPAPEPDLHQRSVRYTFIDYDDYIDDEYDFGDEEEDEDERRKAKKLKLKLVVKLDQEAHGEHALDNGASTSEEESGERKPLRSGGRGGGDEDAEEIGGDDDEEVLKFERDCAAIGFKLR